VWLQLLPYADLTLKAKTTGTIRGTWDKRLTIFETLDTYKQNFPEDAKKLAETLKSQGKLKKIKGVK
jgi:hypothetical protein